MDTDSREILELKAAIAHTQNKLKATQARLDHIRDGVAEVLGDPRLRFGHKRLSRLLCDTAPGCIIDDVLDAGGFD